jgi:hypothetical protein
VPVIQYEVIMPSIETSSYLFWLPFLWILVQSSELRSNNKYIFYSLRFICFIPLQFIPSKFCKLFSINPVQYLLIVVLSVNVTF